MYKRRIVTIGIFCCIFALAFHFIRIKSEYASLIIFAAIGVYLYFTQNKCIQIKETENYFNKNVNINLNCPSFYKLVEQRERFENILKHDLKTPTIAQLRSINMLLDNRFGELTPEQTEILTLTKDSCENMLDMITTILTNYKFEQTGINLNTSPINLQKLVEEACSKNRKTIEKKKLTVALHPPSNPPIVYGDETLLQQAIQSFISNSITNCIYNTDINIYTKQNKNNIQIEIINKGEPITPIRQGKILTNYQKNISKNVKIGFGIKLNLALQIIKAHNGEITIQNHKQGEIICKITLPIYNKPTKQIKELNDKIELDSNVQI